MIKCKKNMWENKKKGCTCWMILRLLWPAARSSRLTIFLILLCMSRTSLNWTSDWRRARVISFKHSFKTFSSMMVALLICWRARDMLPPNWANTIFAQRLEIWVRVRFPFLGGRGIEGDGSGGGGGGGYCWWWWWCELLIL